MSAPVPAPDGEARASTAPSFKGWNPRYVAYCEAHNVTDPDEMIAFDHARFPGGRMTGFIVWIQAMWIRWDRANPGRTMHGPAEHHDFDRWLRNERP